MLDKILENNGPELETDLVLLTNSFNSARSTLNVNPPNGPFILAARDAFDLKKSSIDAKIQQIRNILLEITLVANRTKSSLTTVSENTRDIIVLYT
jgi:hypothetical protein